MSEYKKVDCVGWWEDEDGNRIKVIGIDGHYRAFLYKENDCVKGDCVDIMSAKKYLPDCTGWNWQPERWEDVDPTKITLDMLPMEARFKIERDLDWHHAELQGIGGEFGEYFLSTGNCRWRLCQIRKEEK